MKAAWLKRTEAMVFDPWEIEPSCVIRRLDQLQKAVFN
jgi:hypothetical protein